MTNVLYKRTVVILFGLFLVINSISLHRVPGLMGDEASEGENVYELLQADGITIMGERSYIGPLIDYVRVPFVQVFGYTALAVRLPMLAASLVTFALAAHVFRRWFGEDVGLFPLVFMAFSLPYLTHQRLGWAITLFPFFFFLILWLSQREWQYKWLFVGVAAGLGLHTHIMFAPTLAALAAAALAGPVAAGALSALTFSSASPILRSAQSGAPRNSVRAEPSRRATRLFSNVLLLIIGFWAAFGTQFIVLQLSREDQGDPEQVAELFSQRLADLPTVLPVILSGSSYVAHYTGLEFAPAAAQSVMWLVIILAALGVILSWRNPVVWFWLAGLAVHVLVLLYMIDRFSLRYFLMFVLGVYVLAGVGAGEILVRVSRVVKRPSLVHMKAVGIASVLALLWVGLVLVPFLRTGGSVADFSLGNRTDSAAALVDVRPLMMCLRGTGSVSSENVHIYNRLLYLSHGQAELTVIPEETARAAEYLVHYRGHQSPVVDGELCPALTHFIVAANE